MFENMFNECIAALTSCTVRLGEAKAEVKYYVVSALIAAAHLGYNRDAVKQMIISAPGSDWPLDQAGQPVGEKKARKTRSGATFNSIDANGFSKYMMDKAGVPILSTDAEGNDMLLPKSAGGKAGKPEKPTHLQTEQEKQEVIEAQLDTLRAAKARSAMEFQEFIDKVRATLTTKEYEKISAIVAEYQAAA